MNEWDALSKRDFWLHSDWMQMPDDEFEQLDRLVDTIVKYILDQQLHIVDGIRRYLNNPERTTAYVGTLQAQDVPIDVKGTIMMILYMCLNWGYERYSNFQDIIPALDWFGVWDWCAIAHMSVGPNNVPWMRRHLSSWQQRFGYIEDEVTAG